MVASFSDQVLSCFSEDARLRNNMPAFLIPACSSCIQTTQLNFVEVLFGAWCGISIMFFEELGFRNRS